MRKKVIDHETSETCAWYFERVNLLAACTLRSQCHRPDSWYTMKWG